MPRAVNGTVARNRRKKILRMAKGYRSLRSRAYRKAREAVEKGLTYAYRDRKNRKREFRRLCNYDGKEHYLATYDRGEWVDVAADGDGFWMPKGFICEWE